MDGIDLMVCEHRHIKRMLEVTRKASIRILDTGEINIEDFRSIINFIINYADAHHHGKEEKILFGKMSDEIGGAAEKLVKNGMLVEHDLGRLYIKELENALNEYEKGNRDARVDIIANAVSYTGLLYRHIQREDDVAYEFARRELSGETLKKIDIECRNFEEEKSGVPDKYIKLLESLEKKYIVNG